MAMSPTSPQYAALGCARHADETWPRGCPVPLLDAAAPEHKRRRTH